MKNKKHNIWDTLDELVKFYATTDVSNIEPMHLDDVTYLMDVSKFVRSHLSYVQVNKGKDSFIPYMERLHKLKELIIENKY